MSEKNVHIDTASMPQNGNSKTTQLSSNKTLFWRVFAPVAGTVFWLALNVAFWLLAKDEINFPFLSGEASRIVLLCFTIAWIAYAWFRLMRFHRVEVSETSIILTNYWHTVQYPWKDVLAMTQKRSFLTNVVEIKLASKGRFGQVVQFLPGRHYEEWLMEHRNRIAGDISV